MWRSDIKAILKRINMGLALSKPLACRTGVIFICVCVSQAYRGKCEPNNAKRQSCARLLVPLRMTHASRSLCACLCLPEKRKNVRLFCRQANVYPFYSGFARNMNYYNMFQQHPNRSQLVYQTERRIMGWFEIFVFRL